MMIASPVLPQSDESVSSRSMDFDWSELQASLIKSLGVKMSRRTISTQDMGEMDVPLTTGLVHAKPSEYSDSPRAVSIGRRLQNAFLFRLAATGIFSEGVWLDVGGTRSYGDWLKIPPGRYEVFNLAGVPGTTVVGDFNDADSMDFSRQYDGLISLNSLYMARRPETAVANIMRLLRPGGLAVLDLSVHAYWYVSDDGDHWATFTPLQAADLLSPYMENFLLVPVGNLFEACLDYYARRSKFRQFQQLIRAIGLFVGRRDRDPRTAMHYMAIGQRNKVNPSATLED